MSHENHSPFLLQARLRSKVVFTRFAPTLDALLFEALGQAMGHSTEEGVRQEMRKLLTFNEHYGVFHASSAWLLQDDNQGVSMASAVRVDRRTPEKMSSAMVKNQMPGKKERPNGIVSLTGGATKNRLERRAGYFAAGVSFSGHGDALEIARRLRFASVGVGHDVVAGFGDMTDIEVIPLEEDESLWKDGLPNRPLPSWAEAEVSADLRSELNVGHSALMAPYFPCNAQAAIYPDMCRVASL